MVTVIPMYFPAKITELTTESCGKHGFYDADAIRRDIVKHCRWLEGKVGHRVLP